MNKYIYGKAAVAAIILLILVSCSSNQEIYISGNGNGTATVDIDLHPMVIQYTKDLVGGFSSEDTDNFRIFNVDEIVRAIGRLDNVAVGSISSDSAGELHLELVFSNPEDVFKDSAGNSVPEPITFTRTGGRTRLSLFLSVDNFKAVSTLAGIQNSEVTETFGPQEVPYTEAEYLELMEYLFEEYESASAVRSVIKSAEVKINLTTDRPVISAENCSFKGKEAEITIPLLDIVTLEKPISISLEW